MGPATRNVRWAFTIRSDENNLDNPVLVTSREGLPFEFKENKFSVVVGPIENDDVDETIPFPHRHCFIYSCGISITAGRAKEALASFLGIPHYTASYFKPVDNVSAYSDYMFKTEPHQRGKKRKEREFDEIMADAVSVLKKTKGFIAHNDVVELLSASENQGAYWVSSKKQAIKDYISTPSLLDTRAIKRCILDEETNIRNTATAIKLYSENLHQQLEVNGYDTKHKGVQHFTKEQVKHLSVFLTLLPNFLIRPEEVDDLPGLFFWGAADCGKSFMFNESPSYRKVATDAKGVSRYKLEGAQRAFLLDDWKTNDFECSTNSAAIRQLALGGTSRTKTFGDTVEVRAYLAATTNERPYHLLESPPKDSTMVQSENFDKNQVALRRRFVSIEFTKEVDHDPLHISWMHPSSMAVQMEAMNVSLGYIPPGTVKDSCQSHMDHINEQYEWDDNLNDLLKKVFGVEPIKLEDVSDDEEPLSVLQTCVDEINFSDN